MLNGFDTRNRSAPFWIWSITGPSSSIPEKSISVVVGSSVMDAVATVASAISTVVGAMATPTVSLVSMVVTSPCGE